MYRDLPKLFNPAEYEKQRLIEDFVVRLDTFHTIMEDIRCSDMKHPEQYYLITGQRGMGKTTLLYRIKYEIQDDPKLSKWLIPVSFPEEHYGIFDLASLWENIANYLEREEPKLKGLSEAVEAHPQNEEYERNVFDTIISTLKKKRKKALFLIDNFGELLKKLSELEIKRFREIAMTCPYIRIIAASAVVLEHTFDYKEPFFEFFQEQKLTGLNKEDSITLIRQLSKLTDEPEKIERIIEHSPHRIEAIRRLTGGVIRTIVLLFEILEDSQNGSSFQDLENILDRVTALYKHRMDDLKPQQQLIVDVVAKAWDAVTVKDIMEQGKFERQGIKTNQLSAQLKQLVENQIIEIEKTDTKNHLYRIQERFFNIWYLMRGTRNTDIERVRWLIGFFEVWCSPDDTKRLIDMHIALIQAGNYPEQAAYDKSLALSHIAFLDLEDRQNILKATETFLKERNPSLANALTRNAKMPGSKNIEKAWNFIKQSENLKAAQIFLNEAKKGDKSYAFVAGELFLVEKKYLEAIDAFERIDKNSAHALFGLGRVYEATGQFRKAIHHYGIAIHGGLGLALPNFVDIDIKHGLNQKKILKSVIKTLNSGSIQENIIDSLYDSYLKSALFFICDDIEAGLELSEQYLHGPYPVVLEIQSIFLCLLILSRKQYHFLLRWFEEKSASVDRKAYFKPLYYTLMYYLQDEYPNEFLKAGPELKETIEEMIEKVEQLSNY